MIDIEKLAKAEERIRSFIHYQLLIKEFVPFEIKRVVDIGCGTQEFWRLWYEDGVETFAIDFNNFGTRTIEVVNEATLVHSSERRMWPFANNFFEAATLIDVPSMYLDPAPLIIQSHRLLKKEGILLVVVSDGTGQDQEVADCNQKYRRPDYWCGLIGGLGFRRVHMKLYFTYTIPPFELVRKVFRRFGIPIREHMIPAPTVYMAKRYIFICQK